MAWTRGLPRLLLAAALLPPLASPPAAPALTAEGKPAPPAPPPAAAPAAERAATAVVLDPSGYLAVLLPVVEGEGAATVEIGGKPHPAEVVAREKDLGLALLRIARDGLPAARLGAFESERTAGAVWILGVPAPPAAAEVRVEGAQVVLAGPEEGTPEIHPTATLPGGFPGAALVNLGGQVVGLLGAPAAGADPAAPLPVVGCRALWKLRESIPRPADTIPGRPMEFGEGRDGVLRLYAGAVGRVRFLPGGKPEGPPPLGPGAPLPPFLPRMEKVRGRTDYGNGRERVVAVERALDWLAGHASAAGGWSTDHRAACAGHGGAACTGVGSPEFGTGVTGLALQAFLGMGTTDREGVHAPVVRRGLEALVAGQDAEGCFGGRTARGFLFNHGAALAAVAEALGCTGDPRYAGPVKAGVAFALQCRNPYLAWRYGVRPQDNDTAVTAWMVNALGAARTAGIEVDPAAFEGSLAWLDKVTEPGTWRTGYTARSVPSPRYLEAPEGEAWEPEDTETLSAMAIWARILCVEAAGPCGANRKEEVKEAVEQRLGVEPGFAPSDGDLDFLYVLFGSLAAREEGSRWRKWEASLRKSLESHQVAKGGAKGSWDPVDVWGPFGGRVYATSVLALALETPFRYPPSKRWLTGK